MKRCLNCGQPEKAHGFRQACPSMGTRVDVSAESLERFARSGHPRSMAVAVRGFKAFGSFGDVTVDAITINGEPIRGAQ